MNKNLYSISQQYIGVPFRHQGRDPKIGLDCIGLIICIAKELGIHLIDETSYPRIPRGNYFLDKINQQLVRKDVSNLCEGDIVLFNINGAPSHVGIITYKLNDTAYLLHSYAPSRKVIEHRLTDDWITKIHSVYPLVYCN